MGRLPAPSRLRTGAKRGAVARIGTDLNSPKPQPTWQTAAGITFVELLVVIAIVAILAALLLVAVQQARESARLTGCRSNLRQFGIAVANYEQTYQNLPPGVDPNGYSIHFRLLPYLERIDLYHRFDLSKPYDDPPNSAIRHHGVSAFKCASNRQSVPPSFHDYTSYIGSAGGGNPTSQDGVFLTIARYGAIRSAHITDGTSHTAAMTETVAHPYSPPGTVLHGRGVVLQTTSQYAMPAQRPALIQECLSNRPTPTHRSLGREWVSGSLAVTRFVHILPPNNSSCQNGSLISHGIYSPSSNHHGGVSVLFCDGAVQFVTDTVSRDVWIALGTRRGGDDTEPY